MTSFALCSSADIAKLQLATQKPNGILQQSLRALKDDLAIDLAKPAIVPGHGEAGSFEHNTHKQNGWVIENCGRLYQLTGDRSYFQRAAQLLQLYAEKYLTFPFQLAKNTNPPGRLFHQILNEQMWLLSASLGYDSIKGELTSSSRKQIEEQLFKPMIELFTETYAHDFDRIHNHGLWAVAAVGVCGLIIGDQRAVENSIYGLNGNAEDGGFLAQIAQLFSASGYYIEGPYYHRFAIYPLCMFAQALHVHRPELNIFGYKNQVVKRSISALLMSAYPNGQLPALNDASLTMSIMDAGIIAAVSIYRAHYGQLAIIAETARLQNRVWLHPNAIELASEADDLPQAKAMLWPSIELKEGADGDKGAQGILRRYSRDNYAQQIMMSYGQHGLDHGHFDALGITYYHRDREVLREYGFCRWVNIESKFGGRYLAENKSWARQTIAHNTVTVDETSQNNFDQKLADQKSGQGHFFCHQGKIQAMSAFANQHYDGVGMQRTLLSVPLETEDSAILVDIFRLQSDTAHQYDYAFHYAGNLTNTSASFSINNHQRSTLGEKNGYQHLWNNGHAQCQDNESITWVDGFHFHTWMSATEGCELILAETGANDPEFNLRHQPCFVLRTHQKNHTFVSAIESHGFFDESTERCHGSASALRKIDTLISCDTHSVACISYAANSSTDTPEIKQLLIMINNKLNCGSQDQHHYRHGEKNFSWQGDYAVEYL